MNERLIRKLAEISEEEKAILKGKEIDRDLYYSSNRN